MSLLLSHFMKKYLLTIIFLSTVVFSYPQFINACTQNASLQTGNITVSSGNILTMDNYDECALYCDMMIAKWWEIPEIDNVWGNELTNYGIINTGSMGGTCEQVDLDLFNWNTSGYNLATLPIGDYALLSWGMWFDGTYKNSSIWNYSILHWNGTTMSFNKLQTGENCEEATSKTECTQHTPWCFWNEENEECDTTDFLGELPFAPSVEDSCWSLKTEEECDDYPSLCAWNQPPYLGCHEILNPITPPGNESYFEECEEMPIYLGEVEVFTLPALLDVPCQLHNLAVWITSDDPTVLKELLTKNKDYILNMWPLGYLNRFIGIIQNTFFKNNGLLSTKYGSETVATVEGGNINVTDLSDAILSPMFYKTKVVAEFETVKTLLDNLATQKGFIRVVDTNNRVLKIHPTKLDYEWVTNLLTIEGEQRNESDFVTIDTIGTELININEVGYDSIILKRNWFKIDGFFVTLYDFNSVPLINPTRIEKIKVNGVAYTNAVNLSDAINGL